MRLRSVVLLLLLVGGSGCGLFRHSIEATPGASEEGTASWYGPGFHGNKTASGEVYDQRDLTAAHQTLPLGTRVSVTNLANGREIEVRINDRGPFARRRIIDLSYAAAQAIGMVGPGTATVRIEVLDQGGETMPSATFTIQVGSFADERNATALRERLGTRFGDVRIVPAVTPSGSFFRVRVGTFTQRERAAKRARDLAPIGLTPIVVEDGQRL